MTVSISPGEEQIYAALRAFVLAVAPAGTEVVQGQANRVPEPNSPGFVELVPVRRPRLATNIDEFADCAFVASIAGTAMTVVSVAIGALAAGAPLFGTGVAAGSSIGAQQSGSPGGPGIYAVTPAQMVVLATLSAGQVSLTQETEVVIRANVHHADLEAAGDLAAVLATTFRDGWAVNFFQQQVDGVEPLYCEDPRQVPFTDAEQQYETVWQVELCLQADQTVSGLPQTAADDVTLTQYPVL